MPTMTANERFFWKYAGFGYNPKTETKAQGKRRAAERLAGAELWAKLEGYTFTWEDDWDVDHTKEFGYEPTSCEYCQMYEPDTNIPVHSLGCIDGADRNYRRVIQAELALDVMSEKLDHIKALAQNYA